ncbi:hypothetical protein Tco_1339033 [Tanacetum coccineum]
MPPIEDAIHSRPIGLRLEAAMAKLAETMAKYYPDHVCKYYPNHPSYIPPPTSKPSRLQESMVTLADTISNLDNDPYTLELFNRLKRLANRWDTNTSTITTTPTSTQPIITRPPKNHGLKINHRKPVAKSLNTTAIFITKIKHDVTTQTRVPLHPVIMDMLPIFCCVKTFCVGHQCHPPKLVFLQSELKPHWKSLDPRYTTMSLEDKDRFEARSIDTFVMSRPSLQLNNYS